MSRGMLKKKKWLFFGAVLMLLFMLNGNALANIITNGSFEQGDRTGANWSWKTVYAGDTSITGWTVGGSGVDWHNSAELTAPQDGLYLVDLNLSGPNTSTTLSQSFTTDVGAIYTLNFWLAAPNAYNSVEVQIAGLEELFSQAASSNSSLVWGEKTLIFTATDTTTTLTFSNAEGTGNYWGPLLDNVSVEKVSAVPLPPSLLLLGTGFVGLVGSRILRKKN